MIIATSRTPTCGNAAFVAFSEPPPPPQSYLWPNKPESNFDSNFIIQVSGLADKTYFVLPHLAVLFES